MTPVRRVYEIIHDKKAGKARRFGGLFRFIKTGGISIARSWKIIPDICALLWIFYKNDKLFVKNIQIIWDMVDVNRCHMVE